MATEPASPEPKGTGRAGDFASMPLLAHLEELRRHLVQIGIGIGVAFSACYWKADLLFSWCVAPYEAETHAHLSALTITEPFFVKMRVAFLVSLFASAPWTLFQIWRFISPALYKHERRFAIPFVLSTSVLFILGGAFAYYVGLPAILKFLLGPSASASGFQLAVSGDSYIRSFSHTLLGMGAVFEAPMVAFILARLGLLTAGFLIRKARYAVAAIAVLAAVVTPSGDIPTMVVSMLPMLALYGIAIVVAWLFGKPRRVPSDETSEGARS